MFAKLADGVVRHYKKIFITWMIILLLSIPAVFMVKDVVVYQETEAAPMDIESQKAQEVIDENFAMANSTIIIVLQRENITDKDMRDFAILLENQIRQAASEGQIKYFGDLASIYTLYQGTLQMIAGKISSMVPEVENETISTSTMIYGGPVFYASVWGNSPVNFTVFNDSWTQYSASITNSSQREILYGYHYSYYLNWNLSFLTQPNLSSTERAQLSVNMSVPTYFGSLPLDNETRDFTFAVWQAFNVTAWNDSSLTHSFTVSAVSSAFVQLTGTRVRPDFTSFIEGIWSLGENPTSQSLAAFSRSIVENGTLESYPFLLPEAFLRSFVNTPENDTMLITISLTRESQFAEKKGGRPILDDVQKVRNIVRDVRSRAGGDVATYVSGSAPISYDMQEASSRDVERIDPITVIIIIVLISFFFRSVVAPGIPLATIGVAAIVAQGFIYVVGKYIAGIHYSVLTLLFVVIMSVGCDYAIFLLARYREERRKGADRVESVRTSVTWAGESIATSGATVMLGFGAISIVNYPLLRTMGVCLAVGILIALLVALTLLPSTIMLVGNRIFWPARITKEQSRENPTGRRTKRGYFEKSAKFSVKHAKAIVIVALLISVPTTFGTLTLTTSYDMIAGLPEVESKQGIDAMASGFGAGNIMQTYVVVQLTDEVYSNNTFDNNLLDSIEYLCSKIESMKNIEKISSPTRPMGYRIQYRNITAMPTMEREMYLGAMLQSIGKDKKTVLITVTLREEPYTDVSMNTINAMRSEIRYVREKDSNPNATGLKDSKTYVGGATAGIVDISGIVDGEFRKMATVVLVGVFMILLVVLGSVLIPLRLILTIALSISWTLAVTLLVFQFIVGLPVLWMTPLILFIVLMGLGMDYDIFLVTRIREEVVKGKSDREAIVTAVERTGGIITACGVIMAGAFGSMMLSTLGLLREFGFALAFAILLDAMVVRIYLVPAIMILLEKWNWWAPGRLQRVRREGK